MYIDYLYNNFVYDYVYVVCVLYTVCSNILDNKTTWHYSKLETY